MDSRDIARIKREAKTLRQRDGSMTYMQYLDQAARHLYGVRHFHEAQARYKRTITVPWVETTPAEYYLRSVQEYYLDF